MLGVYCVACSPRLTNCSTTQIRLQSDSHWWGYL